MSSKASGRIKSLRVVLLAAGMALGLGAGAQMPDGRPTPSGFDVPRWVSIKSSPARARRGPGLDHQIMWEYRAAGLPVQVVAETTEWRKVCDPEGAVAWIHRTVSSGRRYVFNASGDEIAVHAGKSETSAVRARLQPRSILALDECEDGWCRLQSGRLNGWAPQEALFGVQAQAQCSASAPAGRAAGR